MHIAFLCNLINALEAFSSAYPISQVGFVECKKSGRNTTKYIETRKKFVIDEMWHNDSGPCPEPPKKSPCFGHGPCLFFGL